MSFSLNGLAFLGKERQGTAASSLPPVRAVPLRLAQSLSIQGPKNIDPSVSVRESGQAERAGGETVAESTRKEKSDEGGSGRSLGVGLAPIRWGGYTTDTFRLSKSSEHSTVIDHSQRLDLRANSYIWQPWFATVSGGIGLAKGLLDSGDSSGESKSASWTGFGDMSLFPQSRFPFSAAFSVSDSTTSSSITTDDMTSKRLSLRQTYRPETGDSNFMASYQNSTMTSKLSGDDVVEAMQGSYSTSLGNHRLGFDAERTETSRSQKSEGLLLDTLNLRHSYSTGPAFTVESNARRTDTTLRLRNSTGWLDSAAQYFQANSYANWHPRENLPLNLTAGISLFTADSRINGSSSESETMSGNLAATYSPTRNLSLGVNGSVAAVSSGNNATNIITTENANASYSGDPLNFGKFSYQWNVSGSVGNQSERASGSNQSLSAGASHGLSREFRISDRTALNLNVNQSFTNYWSGEVGQYSNLNHSGSMSLAFNASDSTSGTLSLNATDTRTMGSQTSENQFINLQGNGRIQLSMYEMVAANLGVQWNRQGGGRVGNDGGQTITDTDSIYTTGSASYQHSRAFGVNNLRYSLLANINAQQSNARLLGDINADTNPVGYSLDQHLDYRIGRIDMSLTGTVSVQDGKENALLFFRVGRSFGNY